MRIALLSYGAGWHVRDLQRAARQRDHEAVSVDWRRVQAAVPHSSTLDGHDAVVVRTMPPGSLEQVVFRMDVLHVLEARGVHVLNPPRALETCVDKYLASARLAAAGLPTPATVLCQDAETAFAAFEKLGGDVVVKPLFGSEGRGIVRVSAPDLAYRTCRALEVTRSVFYLQEFVAHGGRDIRAFVVGGRLVAAMVRRAARCVRSGPTRLPAGVPATAWHITQLDARKTSWPRRPSESAGVRAVSRCPSSHAAN